MQDVVYLDKSYQPSSDPCLGSLLQKYYGNLDAVKILQYVAPVHQSGDMHLAVYDYAQNYMYVASASPVPANGDASQVIPAYNRPFIRLDMASLFQESQ
jgi:isopenicillin-N N-acyltransferase like protein